jgi:hypothetical protein
VLVLVGAEGSALADGDPQGLLLGGVLRAIDQREVVGGLVDGPGGERELAVIAVDAPMQAGRGREEVGEGMRTEWEMIADPFGSPRAAIHPKLTGSRVTTFSTGTGAASLKSAIRLPSRFRWKVKLTAWTPPQL